MKLASLAAGISAALVLACSSAALAGECPAGKAGDNPLKDAPAMPTGVTDTELAAIDLSKENVKLDQRRLRMRHMTVAPGGVVPLHDHADRPALIMVTEGTIVEHSSKCLEPLVHHAGDVSKEFLGTKHWWKNETDKAVQLTIGDIVNDKKPETMQKGM